MFLLSLLYEMALWRVLDLYKRGIGSFSDCGNLWN